jgi:hypothetical protein
MRTLTLRQESLADLTSDELAVVAGGSGGCFASLPPTCECTGYYPSLNAPCSLAC